MQYNAILQKEKEILIEKRQIVREKEKERKNLERND